MVGPKQSIVRIDLTTRRVTGVIGLPWVPGGIATGGGSVWVPQDFGSELVRIDARTGKISGRFDLGKRGGANTGGVAYGDGTLWLAQDRGVARLDPRTVRVVHRFHAPARLLVFADGAVWAATPGDGRVTKIDPVENRIAARTKLHGWLSDLAVGGGSVWTSILPDGVVFRLSEDDLGVQSVLAAGTDPERISFGGGHLWIANTAARSVSLLDQVSGARQRLVATAGPTLAQYHDGLVWTSAAPAPAAARTDRRRGDPRLDTDRHGGRPGSDGRQGERRAVHVRDLLEPPQLPRLLRAPRCPAPTRDRSCDAHGLSRRTHLHLSHPSRLSLLAALERARDRRNVPAHAGAVSRRPRTSIRPARASPRTSPASLPTAPARPQHISGIAVRGNTLSITLVKPAGDFLTRLSMSAFCPVPLSVPIHVNGFTEHPIPSAGPYYVASLQGDRTVLLRNPNYHGDRPRRPERIVFTNDIPTPKAVTLADAGALDLLPQDFDNTTSLLWPGGALDQRSGATSPAGRAGRQQYFLYAAPLVDYIVFNTRRPLFRDVRLRRAASYALDRRALAASFSDGPADQIVSPAVPGFPGRARLSAPTRSRHRPPARRRTESQRRPLLLRQPAGTQGRTDREVEPRADRDIRLDHGVTGLPWAVAGRRLAAPVGLAE